MTCNTTELAPRTYLLGNGVRVTAKLRDSAGVVLSPTVLRLLVAGPNDTESTEIPLTPDADNIHAVGFFVPDAPGTWRYRVEATSLADAAYERTLTVVDRTVPPPP